VAVFTPIVVGFCAGVIAWFLMPRMSGSQGFAATTILGMIASVASALFAEAAGFFPTGDSERIAGSALGAAVVLLLWAAINGERGHEP
jgi:uncharacterized membrane protein YeaQ/YmgE (transglycosylase-associated protein family)